MRLSAHDVNDASPKMSPRASQDASQDTLKAPEYPMFRGFLVSGTPGVVLATPGSPLAGSVVRRADDSRPREDLIVGSVWSSGLIRQQSLPPDHPARSL
jgi:hypothetical protein